MSRTTSVRLTTIFLSPSRKEAIGDDARRRPAVPFLQGEAQRKAPFAQTFNSTQVNAAIWRDC
jgi:hypothetical protein